MYNVYYMYIHIDYNNNHFIKAIYTKRFIYAYRYFSVYL